MKKFFLSWVCFFNFLAVLYAAGNATSGCLEKEKALALLETAENFLLKARDAYPSCKKSVNSTNQCDGEKSLAYIEISRKMISDVRENFPSCTNYIIDEDNEQDENLGDCSEILASGRNKSGVYKILLGKNMTMKNPQLVYCDMDTEGGGWTVIQRRGKFLVQQDFYLDWESYKNGFGNLTEEFWFGNENIRVLCLKGCKIRFDLQEETGVKMFALYQAFSLTNNYSVDISEYSGNASDAMRYHNKMEFSTKDRGNVGLAKTHQSGWWHASFFQCNLNGIYLSSTLLSSVYWYLHGNYRNLTSVEIKVIPN